MRPRRLPNWQQELNKLIEANQYRPFVWGEWDCALWAAEAIRVMTGQDYATPYRGQYSSSEECAQKLRDEGPGSLYKLAVEVLGEPIHPALAQRGDVVYRASNMPTLGICYGSVSFFVGEAFGQEGLVGEPTLNVKHAFRVPF